MKLKVSISLDEETIKKADGKLSGGLFRNRSHLIEYVLTKFLQESG